MYIEDFNKGMIIQSHHKKLPTTCIKQTSSFITSEILHIYLHTKIKINAIIGNTMFHGNDDAIVFALPENENNKIFSHLLFRF